MPSEGRRILSPVRLPVPSLQLEGGTSFLLIVPKTRAAVTALPTFTIFKEPFGQTRRLVYVMASYTTRRRMALLALVPLALAAQSADRFIGTIQSIKAESLEVVIKPDSGEPRTVKLIPQTIFQRVAPGEKDLKQAVTISAGDLATGDRVLVTLQPSTTDVRRLIVMSATDINKRNEAERQDWMKRGLGGLVTAKKDNEVTVKTRSMAGETEATVVIGENTKVRRYAPDSVRFADAKSSSLAEVSVGDQLRARGQKNETNTRVTAEEVVFGTFITKAGKVTAVNPDAKEVTVLDSATNKPLIIKLTADSQLKKMLSFGGPGGPGRPRGAPGSGGRCGPAPCRGCRCPRLPGRWRSGSSSSRGGSRRR